MGDMIEMYVEWVEGDINVIEGNWEGDNEEEEWEGEDIEGQEMKGDIDKEDGEEREEEGWYGGQVDRGGEVKGLGEIGNVWGGEG